MLQVDSDVDPLSLTPSKSAQQTVTLENPDSIGYTLTILGKCGPCLLYDKTTTWGPEKRRAKSRR